MLELLEKIWSVILKFVYNLVSFLPEVPSPAVALDTLDLVTEAGVACRYFLPTDTIAELTIATLGVYGLKVIVAILRSEFAQSLLKAALTKLTGVLGIFFK